MKLSVPLKKERYQKIIQKKEYDLNFHDINEILIRDRHKDKMKNKAG